MLTLAPSMRPYLIRAIVQWCEDQAHTPHVLVLVDSRCRVPREFVQQGQIVLNIGALATQGLHIDDHFLRFKARFSGRVHEVEVPLGRVVAVYARESAQGLAFEVEDDPPAPTPQDDDDAAAAPKPSRPALRRVK